MAEIATWSAILNKTGLGKSSNECPTKAELLALNNNKDTNIDKLIVISNASTYGNNECVKLEDINSEQWVYTLAWDRDPSFNAPATGGTYSWGSYDSIRTKYIDGVGTTVEEVPVTGNSEASWYSWNSPIHRTVPNNTSTDIKSYTKVITQAYSGKTITATFTQAAGSKVYSDWNYNYSVDKTSFTYEGGQANVTAKTATRSYTWNGKAGSGDTETVTATVTVSSPATISGNTISIPTNEGEARNFTVTFKFSGLDTKVISISQEAGQITYVYHLEIDPTSKTIPAVDNSSATDYVTVEVSRRPTYDKYINGILVDSNITGNKSDIHYSITQGYDLVKYIGEINYTFTVYVKDNFEEVERHIQIKFTYHDATPVFLDITQSAATIYYEDYSLTQNISDPNNGPYTKNNIVLKELHYNYRSSASIYMISSCMKKINGSDAERVPVMPFAVLDGDWSTEMSKWESYTIEKYPKISEFHYKATLINPKNPTPNERVFKYRFTNKSENQGPFVNGIFYQEGDPYKFVFLVTNLEYFNMDISGDKINTYGFELRISSFFLKNGNSRLIDFYFGDNLLPDWIKEVTIVESTRSLYVGMEKNYSGFIRSYSGILTQNESNKTIQFTINQSSIDSRVILDFALGMHLEWCFVYKNSTAALHIKEYLSRDLYGAYSSNAVESGEPQYSTRWSPVDKLIAHTINSDGTILRGSIGDVGMGFYILVWTDTKKDAQVYADITLEYGDQHY